MDKEEIYRRADLGHRTGFGARPACLVVDFQKAYCTPDFPGGADFTTAVTCTSSLLDACRAADVPIIFSVVSYDDPVADGGRFIEKCPTLEWSVAGGEGVELDPRLERRNGERVLLKKYASSFFGTDLGSLLVSLGTDTLLVAGCTTSGCVRATVVDGMQHGYRVIVPRECVADIAVEPHEANLFDIDAKYGDVVSLADTTTYVRQVGQR
jgi:nicotinamidase-related amidase